jgi:DNA adenine methylase
MAKPFLKWAGGKSWLIEHIEPLLPPYLSSSSFTYVEPFVGSGAMLFWFLDRFPKMEKAIINDLNGDLINVYRTIALQPEELISILDIMQKEYHLLEDDEDGKKIYYYDKRDKFNLRDCSNVNHAALFIFLNRTCFNGLYRVNKSNKYNVPMGRYKNPTICDRSNLLAVSEALKKVEIRCGDYADTLIESGNPIYYFDPPYKPISVSSSFGAYTKDGFGDGDQFRLKEFCDILDSKGYNWFLSNSDVRENGGDNFFDDMYSKYNILRVNAKRSINSNKDGRGLVSEIIINNIYL